MSIFLPTIVGQLGYKAVDANLMTAPVYFSAYALLLITAYLSDRFNSRGIPIIIGGALSGVGYMLLGTLTNVHARYGMTFLAAIVRLLPFPPFHPSPPPHPLTPHPTPKQGTYIAFPIVLSWILSTFAADTKSGVGIGIVIAVTHAVGVAASNIFPSSQSPQYTMGCSVSGALGFVAAIAAALMILLLHRENRRRDRVYGRPEGGAVAMTGEADMVAEFRYAL